MLGCKDVKKSKGGKMTQRSWTSDWASSAAAQRETPGLIVLDFTGRRARRPLTSQPIPQSFYTRICPSHMALLFKHFYLQAKFFLFSGPTPTNKTYEINFSFPLSILRSKVSLIIVIINCFQCLILICFSPQRKFSNILNQLQHPGNATLH